MLTERDYARKIVLQDRSSRTTKVRDIMTDSVYYVRPEDTREHCMALMTERHFRHCPSSMNRNWSAWCRSATWSGCDERAKFIITELERYISGER